MPTIAITSPDDDRLIDFRALNDQAFRRKFEGDDIFIAEGYVAIGRLIESGHKLRSVLLAPSRVARFEHHMADLEAAGVPVLVADKAIIAEAVGFDLHRGVIACALRRPHVSTADLAASCRRIAVLEGLNDAENLGAIARAARAFGIDGMVIDPTCTDPYSRRTVRVSMGEVLFLPISRPDVDDWRAVLDELRSKGFMSWAMTPTADASNLWALEVPERLAVIFGAEGPGLAERTMASSDYRVRIPIRAEVDSLNVGHSAAITFAAIDRPTQDFSGRT